MFPLQGGYRYCFRLFWGCCCRVARKETQRGSRCGRFVQGPSTCEKFRLDKSLSLKKRLPSVKLLSSLQIRKYYVHLKFIIRIKHCQRKIGRFRDTLINKSYLISNILLPNMKQPSKDKLRVKVGTKTYWVNISTWWSNLDIPLFCFFFKKFKDYSNMNIGLGFFLMKAFHESFDCSSDLGSLLRDMAFVLKGIIFWSLITIKG